MFYIVGCNHGIQPGTGGFTALDTADQNEQRAYFRAVIQEICVANGIEIVLEEYGDLEETIGNQLADHFRIPWRDINTSNADKDRMGIPQDYVAGPYSDEQRANWNYQREQFMLAKICEYRKNTTDILIICGFDHMRSLALLLAEKGAQVQETDYRRLEWYRSGVFHD